LGASSLMAAVVQGETQTNVLIPKFIKSLLIL
jgi:hypothetical protein